MIELKYPGVFSKLTYETATLVFLKKDGTVRVMLATRNLRTSELEYGFLGGRLSGHDSRCNINNGNIAVIDMIIGEPRSFNIDRLLSIDYHGVITTREELERVVEMHQEFKREYESNKPMEISMDMLD